MEEMMSKEEREKRRKRVEQALGGYVFNPWDRNPSPAEQRSLLADGLTREYFVQKEIEIKKV